MENRRGGAEVVMSEVKTQLRLATPLAVGSLLQKIIQTISLMFVGRLGELPRASASLATSFAAVTGFSVMRGMASSLDTLCGQAFGAGQHQLLGVYKQRAMAVLTLASVPVSVAWAYAGEILVLLRQDPEIAAGAGRYARCMIPALFAYALLECHLRFLQAQNVVVPAMLSSAAAAAAHVAVCWLLVFRLGLGASGAVLGTAVSNLFNLCVLTLYVRLAPACKATWEGFSGEAAFRGIPGFLKLAVPSALMLCMEWWAFEILVILSGLLPNPKLQTAVVSICFNTCAFAFMVPLGLSNAVSVRVSNELGAGRPEAARLATRVAVALAVLVGLSEGLAIFLARNVLGYAYSNDREVALYTARMMPILAVSALFDSIQGALSGVVRGCGRQKIGAFTNLAAYYLAGIPAACVFAFVCHLRGMGLWLGILFGLVVQMLLLLSIMLSTNWNNESLKAKGRVSSPSRPVELTAPPGCAEQSANGRGSAGTETQQGITGATKGSVSSQTEG